MLDSTADAGQLQQELATWTNRKSEFWTLLKTTGEEMNQQHRNFIEARGRHNSVKVSIKECDDHIRSIKELLRSERSY